MEEQSITWIEVNRVRWPVFTMWLAEHLHRKNPELKQIQVELKLYVCLNRKCKNRSVRLKVRYMSLCKQVIMHILIWVRKVCVHDCKHIQMNASM